MKYLTLEEADFPVYGLPPDTNVYGLTRDDSWPEKSSDTVILSYESRIYRPFVLKEIREPILKVRSRSWAHTTGMIPLSAFGSFRPSLHFPEVPRLATSGNISLFIGGVQFTGGLVYWVRPLFFTSFGFTSECLSSIPNECEGHCVRLSGHALGPSIDEVVQILESLHVLNG